MREAVGLALPFVHQSREEHAPDMEQSFSGQRVDIRSVRINACLYDTSFTVVLLGGITVVTADL